MELGDIHPARGPGAAFYRSSLAGTTPYAHRVGSRCGPGSVATYLDMGACPLGNAGTDVARSLVGNAHRPGRNPCYWFAVRQKVAQQQMGAARNALEFLAATRAHPLGGCFLLVKRMTGGG